jgi:ADP-ribosyl-[dinitrogen reductase] hydrolase
MLVEMAIADAYAIPWEFTDKQTAKNDLMGFYQHPTYDALKPGQYTDDTQRSIANAHVLLGASLDRFNPSSYAQSYLDQFRRDPREGYSRGYQAFISSTPDAKDFLTKIERTKLSNGSLMGVAPMGFLSDLREVKLAAMIQAITTHHPNTVIHAQLVAMAVHYFVHCQGDQDGLITWLHLNAPFASTGDADLWLAEVEAYKHGGKTGIRASSISAWMAWAVTEFTSLQEIIHRSVEAGGDTDSAAAVAVAVASCALDDEIEKDIPAHLLDQLDIANPGFGIQYLSDLEQRLRDKYGAIK